jgi:hypothetical protein
VYCSEKILVGSPAIFTPGPHSKKLYYHNPCWDKKVETEKIKTEVAN